MRIEGPSRSGAVNVRNATTRSASGAAFIVDSGTQSRAASVASAAPTGSIETLIALQSVEDPTFAKKKAVRRARSLLDTLDAVKADLLVGQVSEGKLQQLSGLLSEARRSDDPGLQNVIDDIELRVQVELAKFGRFAG